MRQINFLLYGSIVLICLLFWICFDENLKISLLIYSLLNLLYYIYIFNKSKSLLNSFVITPIIWYMYTVTYPFFSYIGLLNKTLFQVSKEKIILLIDESIISFTIYFLLTLLYNGNSKEIQLQIKKIYFRMKLKKRLVLLMFLILDLIILNLILKKDLEILKFELGYTPLILSAVSLYSVLVYFSELFYKKKNNLFYLSPAFLFLLFNLQYSRRRSVLLIIIFSYFLKKINEKKIVIEKKEVVVIILSTIIFLNLGLVRQKEHIKFKSERKIFSKVAEFILPNAPYFLDREYFFQNLQYGKSFVQWPIYFIPRKIYAEKPNSLALDFIMKYKFKGGGGYTPLMESIYNFGKIGPYFCGVYIYIVNLLLLKYIKKIGYIYGIFLGFSFDFFRGEFGTVLFQIIIIVIIIIIMRLLTTTNKKIGEIK